MVNVNAIGSAMPTAYAAAGQAPAASPGATLDSPPDTVSISPGAQRAQEAAQFAAKAAAQSEIREREVREAEQRILEGSYKMQQIVLQVAAKIGRFVDAN